MKITLEFITPNATEFIGRMAAICYDAKTTPDVNTRRAINCKDRGHLATLRFASAVFHISGISRTCSHQFVRSKHLDFLQRSQRYCKEDEISFVVPQHLTGNALMEFDMVCQHSLNAYKYLLAQGVKKEDARFVLSEASETELNVVGNLQAWQDFIDLRSGPEAQWEIRAVAIEINNILAQELPELFTKK